MVNPTEARNRFPFTDRVAISTKNTTALAVVAIFSYSLSSERIRLIGIVRLPRAILLRFFVCLGVDASTEVLWPQNLP